MKQQRYPKGHFLGLGIAFGIPLGIPIGFAIGNIGIGPLIGAIIGIPIGLLLEKQKNPNPRLMTKEEKIMQNRNIKIVLGTGIILFLIILTTFLLI